MINRVFHAAYEDIIKKTDRTLATLLAIEWPIAVILAIWISPRTWAGDYSQTHLHLLMAIFMGGLLTLFPIYHIWKNPGAVMNRQYATIAQCLYSILFIHLTGGRIETHFHIFVSLAFFSFYLDWKVLLIPTIITLVDHFARGFWFPQSVYGVSSATVWRAYEHGAWVLFEDIVLLYLIHSGKELLRSNALKHTALLEAREGLEEKVRLRTQELSESKQKIIEQQQQLVSSSKMSALGEMASGIAHEINNPLAVIAMFSDQITNVMEQEIVDKVEIAQIVMNIESTVERIAKIISSLRSFARDGSKNVKSQVNIKKMIDDTLVFCNEKIKTTGTKLMIDSFNSNLSFLGRDTEISQVLLNLLNNANDAISTSTEEKWIKISVVEMEAKIKLSVTDSGHGIPVDIESKIFDPFFTTKDVGKGTGMGLSISAGIIKANDGIIFVDKQNQNTTFTIELMKAGPE
jgi:signal transduction histidine kinase